jgi:nicotinate-nucleotide adenylyltransferase
MEAIGILGGTFDPIHCGHLRLAVEMAEQLRLASVRLIPARQPPHREPPQAAASLRLRMLRAALGEQPQLVIDERELQREGPSYTVDTLHSFRRSFPDAPLCLLLGMDAFCSLDTWHRWAQVCELAHLGVGHRPGAPPPTAGPVAQLLAKHRVDDPTRLVESPAGCIVLREIPALDISASDIRARIAQGRSVRYLVPDGVWEMIHNESVYHHGQRRT